MLSELFITGFKLGDDVQWVTGLKLSDVLGRNDLKLEALEKLVTRLSKPHTRIAVNKKLCVFCMDTGTSRETDYSLRDSHSTKTCISSVTLTGSN